MRFKDNNNSAKTTLNLHEGHRGRLREGLILTNFVGEPDHKVVEYLLTLVIKRKDTNELAHTLIKTFGSLAGVLDASIEELQQVKGITYNIAYFLHALPLIYRNYKLSKGEPKTCLNCAQDIFNFLGSAINHLGNEEFYMICLDNGNKVICYKLIASGGNSQVAINSREMIKYANKNNAKKVVFVHNHPSASSEPSAEDIETTKRLYIAFSIEGISVFDHLIVNKEDEFYSFAHEGLLIKFEEECKNFLKI